MPKRSSKKLSNRSDELASSSVDAATTSAQEEGGHPTPASGAVYTEPDIAPEPVKKPARTPAGKHGGARGVAARAKPLPGKRRVKTATREAPRRRKST